MAQKVFVFCPAFGQTITATTFMTTCAVLQHLAAKGLGGGVSTLSFPDIAELRAMATTIWYDTMPDVRYILFIDADMGFPPDLITDMILFDEPLIGTIYPQRRLPLSWAGSGTGQAQTERRGNFMLVEGVGMGCTLIRRDLIDKMIAKFPELIDTRLALHPAGETLRGAGTNRLLRLFEKMDIPERGVISEDLSFCIRAAQCGVQTWASIGHRMSHVGPYDYGARYLDMVEAAERQMAEQQDAAAQQAVAAVTLQPTMGGSTLAEPLQIVPAMPMPAPIVISGGDVTYSAPDALARPTVDVEGPPAEVIVVTETSATARRKTRNVGKRANGRARGREHARRAQV